MPMGRLDSNIDACRLSNDVLTRLRKVVRETLRATYGSSWEESGIPADIREFLIQRQAREASINWNLSDSCDVLDFAGYLNLSDIIAGTPGLFQLFLALAPDKDVVRMRFLELDTILNRIAYARPISEADLGLLATFDDRLKKILAAPLPAVEIEDEAPTAPRPAPKVQAVAPPAPVTASSPAPPPAVPRRATAQKTPAPAAPPPPPVPAPAPQPDGAPDPARAPQPLGATPQIGPDELESALKQGKSKVILTALYQEVTALADGLWNGSVTTLQARAWERVRESPWYRDQFAKLGLKPISDFFGLFESAREKTLSGSSRAQVQDSLKEHNFVQVLLALKELFRQHVRA